MSEEQQAKMIRKQEIRLIVLCLVVAGIMCIALARIILKWV